MDDPVHLSGDELRFLAELVWGREVEAMKSIAFDSQTEYVKYHEESKAAYDEAVGLLDMGDELVRQFPKSFSAADGDEEPSTGNIAEKILFYLFYALDGAIQGLGHYRIRMYYLGKVKNYANEMIVQLKVLNPDSEAQATALFYQAEESFKIMKDQSYMWYQSNYSQAFTRWFKNKGTQYAEIITDYTKNLFPGYETSFDELNFVQKTKVFIVWVYSSIVEISGRGGGKVLEIVEGTAGLYLITLTGALIVADVLLSQTPGVTAVRDLANVGVAFLGIPVGWGIGALMEAALTAVGVGAAVTSWAVILLGIGIGLALSHYAGNFAADKAEEALNWLHEHLFSGGKTPLSISSSAINNLGDDQLPPKVVPTPNAKELALRIARMPQR